MRTQAVTGTSKKNMLFQRFTTYALGSSTPIANMPLVNMPRVPHLSLKLSTLNLQH